MKVTQEKLPASQIGLEIEITPEMTQQKYEQVIKNFSRAAHIPGFRKGKVPRQVLLQRLGTVRIKATALEELIEDGIKEAIKQEEIPAIGQAQLRSSFEELIDNYQPGQPLTFQAAVDVEPEVNLKQYTDLHLKAEEVTYDPSRVDKTLEDERSQMATLIPTAGRAAQIGDVAVVDFKGVIPPDEGADEGAQPEPIPGGEANDFQVELQEDRFIPGFVTGIVGMNPGETKEIEAQFPDPYANEELAGKKALFTVTLHELKEKELPELNDDFAQEASEYETLAQLRASLEERYQKEASEKTKANKQQAISDALVQHLEVDLPETLVQQEIDSMLMQTAMQLSRQGIDVRKLFTQDVIPQLRERSRPEAIDRIKRNLGLQEVAKRESITVEPQEIAARVQELMQEYAGQDVDADRLREVVAEELLTDKIMNWLEEHNTFELLPEGSLSTEETDVEADSDIAESTDETATAAEVSEAE